MIITKKYTTRASRKKTQREQPATGCSSKAGGPAAASERLSRVVQSSSGTSELGKPEGEASEIKVQLLLGLFKSLYISCKFSLLANTQK